MGWFLDLEVCVRNKNIHHSSYHKSKQENTDTENDENTTTLKTGNETNRG